jgi:outer membrane protein
MLFIRQLGYVCLLAGAAWSQQVLTLKQALEQVDRMNPDLAIARLRTVEAEAVSGAVRSGYQPQANLIVQSAYQTSNLQGIGLLIPGFSSRIGPFRTFNARPQVTQTVIDLGLLTRIRASRAQQGVTKLEADAVKDDLAIAVVELYIQALQSDSRIAASEARLASTEAVLRQVRDKEQAGSASKLDVARAEEQLENERGLRAAARRDAAVLRALLATAIGVEGSLAEERLEKPAFELPEEAALQNRPDLKALEARVAVAALDRKAAAQQKLPKLTAFADWGVLGAGPDQSIGTYTVGATLTIPLWTGRRIESEVAAASAREDQTKQQIRRARIQIRQELQQFTTELQAALEIHQTAARAAAASRNILELATLRFQSGLATSVDTQVAQSGLAEAEDRRIRAEHDVLLAQARLAKAGGTILSAVRK